VRLVDEAPLSVTAVVRGHLWVCPDDEQPVRLEAGDLALVTCGERHMLSDRPDGDARPFVSMPIAKIVEGAARLPHGGDGARTVLVCSKIHPESLVARLVFKVMPKLVVVRGAEHRHDILGSLLTAMTSEVLAARPGGPTVLTRLADVVVIHAVRSWLTEASQVEPSWLLAFRDDQIGRAIALVHERPEHDWSVPSLAAAVGMSRSTFAERFGALVGVSPKHYVTRLRMDRANELMRSENLSVAELAGRLGYESEAAFSRAFKRHMGVSPGASRRLAS
jgi:AraC-like DNA-binding protein